MPSKLFCISITLTAAVLVAAFPYATCQAEDTQETELVSPCTGFEEDQRDDYRPSDEEIARGDAKARHWQLSHPTFRYMDSERWLADLGPEPNKYLLQHVDDRNAKTRANAIYLLQPAGVPDDQACDIYQKHLTDPCRHVQAVAAVRMMQQGNRSAEVLAALVRNVDSDWYDVRDGIREFGHAAYAPLVAVILDSEQPMQMRNHAQSAFPYGAVAVNPAFRPLFAALDSEDPTTQTLAAFTITQLQDVEDQQRLIEVLIDQIVRDTEYASDAISAIGLHRPMPDPDTYNAILLQRIAAPDSRDIKFTLEHLIVSPSLLQEIATHFEKGHHPSAIAQVFCHEWNCLPATPGVLARLEEMIRTQHGTAEATKALGAMGPEGIQTLLKLAFDTSLPTDGRVLSIFHLSEQLGGGFQSRLIEEELDRLATLLDDKNPDVAQMTALVLTFAKDTSHDVTSLLLAARSADAYPLIHRHAQHALPTNPQHMAKLVDAFVALARETKEEDNNTLLYFFGKHGGHSEAACDLVIDAIAHNWESHLDSSDVNDLLVTRLRNAIARHDVPGRARLMKAYFDILSSEFRWHDNIDMAAHLGQGPPAGLKEASESSDRKLSKNAMLLRSLYEPKSPEVIEALIAMLDPPEEETDSDYQSAAMHRLNQLDEPLLPFVPRLAAMLDSPSNRFLASSVLETLGPKGAGAEEKYRELLDNEETFELACRGLIAIGPDAISAAGKVWENGRSREDLKIVAVTLRSLEADTSELQKEFDRRLADPYLKYDALEQLSWLAPDVPIADRYVEALRGNDGELKLIALNILAQVDVDAPQEIVPLLTAEIESGSQKRRELAVQGLGEQHGLPEKSIPLLLQIMRNDPELDFYASTSLGKFGEAAAAAVPDLIADLKQKEMQLPAIQVLGEIGPPAREAVPLLTSYAAGKHPVYPESGVDSWDQYKAIKSLGRLGPVAESALPTLLSEYRITKYADSLEIIARSIYQISPGFGAVNGIPRPPEPQPVRMQWSW